MDTLSPTPPEAVVLSIASKSTGGGASLGVLGWMTDTETIAIAGVVIAILGLIVNIIFQIRRDLREAELQKAQLGALGVVQPKD